jgi:hypothetical protein
MPADRPASRMVDIWELVARQAAGRQARVSIADVCAAAVTATAVSGAALTAVTQAGGIHLMYATDQISERLAGIELTLGEGPRADAVAFGGPVLTSDLAHGDAAAQWPAFAAAAREAGAEAVFAFPLQVGAIRAGVLQMYRQQPGPLSAGAFGDALLFAETATLVLLDAAAQGAPGTGPGGQPIELGLHRAEIDQATGMLTEQLGTGADQAFARLRAYAYAQDRSLSDVARDIVERRLRLLPDDGLTCGGGR